MPTSPKTAKQILEEFDREIVNNQKWELIMKYEGATVCEYKYREAQKAFLLSSLRAAVEAVRPKLKECSQLPECEKCIEFNRAIYRLDQNSNHFFNDDPTSPPTPRNEKCTT